MACGKNHKLSITHKNQKRQCYRRSIYYYKRNYAAGAGLEPAAIVSFTSHFLRALPLIVSPTVAHGPVSFHTLRRCRSVSGYQVGHFPCRSQNHLLGRWAGHGSLARRLTFQAVGYFDFVPISQRPIQSVCQRPDAVLIYGGLGLIVPGLPHAPVIGGQARIKSPRSSRLPWKSSELHSGLARLILS